MSYRFNKDTKNSKDTSFNKRSSNYYRKDNDSRKSNFNDRRRTNNKINRLSSDQTNEYSYEKQPSEDLRSNNNSNTNYRGANRFERKTSKPSYRNLNAQISKNDKRRVTNDPIAYSESFTKTLSDDLIWGRHSTEAALLGGRAIHRIWCTSELRSSPKFFQLLKDAKASGVLVEEVSWSRLGQITNGAVHQGIVLQIAASKTHTLTNLIEACKPFGDTSLLLALDGLTDPQNLGAIIRSAEALGAQGLILPQRRSAGLTGSVAKVAAGALEHLPVARVVNLNRSLEKLKDEGYAVVGLAEEGASTLSEIKFQGPLVVVVGSEDKGISLITRRLCDQLVRIPLKGVTTSLNASVATSIFLYEVARCRWMRSISGQDPSPRLLKPQISTEVNN
ncbi:23S rRNA (guanosine(2251)-2'-O)-methyltransferase RlmB [Prochlorococcus marinus]|uniref:23S rRNA (Guanosine(2251)-2'-O)-methyltransferase RlmB n=1 Tax=Prochlorococcus marinus XMU1408 TaxID=2213228 RepID=A0A318R623_PROMR|nr:23S rRNA (guanosine(2251)-2'-O)-methyltransferase RlmB [Prochlorococcus marinus]MBW3041891.1 23S rRNA (guanosine(2251)-2'-O)-methyltransferase RlmB [Prochlorococcus marinus str. XMU1408]PYE03022.1 23S rRNA (guanosine(2251)-2'-O)-methyltransferase RlmB [Prochlorococcus marinus XMU1408]